MLVWIQGHPEAHPLTPNIQNMNKVRNWQNRGLWGASGGGGWRQLAFFLSNAGFDWPLSAVSALPKTHWFLASFPCFGFSALLSTFWHLFPLVIPTLLFIFSLPWPSLGSFRVISSLCFSMRISLGPPPLSLRGSWGRGMMLRGPMDPKAWQQTAHCLHAPPAQP